jgi:hypothetical protein
MPSCVDVTLRAMAALPACAAGARGERAMAIRESVQRTAVAASGGAPAAMLSHKVMSYSLDRLCSLALAELVAQEPTAGARGADQLPHHRLTVLRTPLLLTAHRLCGASADARADARPAPARRRGGGGGAAACGRANTTGAHARATWSCQVR